MRRAAALISLVLLPCACVPSPAPAPPAGTPLTLDDLDRPVIGRLGVPLGTSVEIVAEIVDGDTIGNKASQGTYLLRVTEIDGKPPSKPVVMSFSVRNSFSVRLANDDFDLCKLKTGQTTGSLNSDQIAVLKKDYVGSSVKLGVYERGGYSGIPDSLPDGTLEWQDHGFGFSTWLEVLVQRE